MHSRSLFSVLAFSSCLVLTAASCYYENGTLAFNDIECGYGSNYCCPSGDKCVTNGLCQDKNNNDDGSLTYFPGKADPGPYNYTGLYSASSCQDPDWETGCPAYCVTGGVAGDAYLWACDDATTEFCCHDDGVALRQGDCCSRVLFTLSSRPVALSVAAPSTTPFATRSTYRFSTRTSTSRRTSTTARYTYGFPYETQSTSRYNLFPTPTDGFETPDAVDDESRSGLSAGGLAGVVVGACFALFSLMVLAVFGTKYLLQKRAARAPDAQQPQPQPQQPQAEQSAFMTSQQYAPVGVLPPSANTASATPQMAQGTNVSG